MASSDVIVSNVVLNLIVAHDLAILRYSAVSNTPKHESVQCSPLMQQLTNVIELMGALPSWLLLHLFLRY
ncbi:transmembrane protein, putative [Medicago truncatula]|uniref:Transmembrane protein, putative n=1 Tax=Medicago truncatula TaxID=3880 RepID=A0A072UGL1_MEDTR|nr:transmembrane protein, putative [Medicago truncatula]